MAKGIGREFLEKTKYKNMGPTDQMQNLPHPPVELEAGPAPGGAILLPPVKSIADETLTVSQAIKTRRTVRQYADKALTREELSYLLWCTQGVKSIERHLVTLRTVPSAGARHAFETYLLINRVEGLTPGLYRFLAVDHELAPVNLAEDIGNEITLACLNQNFIKSSAVTFIWTAALYRMVYRYGERGYRYLYLDAGHVCQNLYLAAEVIDSGVCAIGAFDDDKLNAVLGLDGEQQFVVYAAAAGKK